MRGDDLANGIGIDHTYVEDERDEVLVQDAWVEGEVDGHEGPDEEEGDQAEKGVPGSLTAPMADPHYVVGAAEENECQQRLTWERPGQSYLDTVLKTSTAPP